jgi:hypothetical protein
VVHSCCQIWCILIYRKWCSCNYRLHDYYISNLFDEISLKELINRLNKIEEIEKQDVELVKIFEETFGGVYREKYFKLIERRQKFNYILSIILRYVLFFSVPITILILFLRLVLNPQFQFLDPLTYVNDENWSKLEFIFTLIQIVLIPTCIYLNKKWGYQFQNWIFKK